MIWQKELPYFPMKELACKGSGIIQLDMRFAAALPHLRMKWGKPLIPTSVCRTPSHNAEVGGHPRSLHLTENPAHPTDGTLAADLYWKDWAVQDKINFARLAYRLGWSLGLHATFIHVDLRKAIGLNQAIFTYPAWDDAFSREEIF